jgi:hypothetical protein
MAIISMSFAALRDLSDLGSALGADQIVHDRFGVVWADGSLVLCPCSTAKIIFFM